MKLYKTLENTLKKEPNFITDNGELKKWVIINKARNYDEELIGLLLGDKEIKEKFFFNIKGVTVFNQSLFIRFLEQKNYLNDSYTAYKNKVGLTIDGKYLKQLNEVALVWPFKDCVLEGGQTREEDGREEIFFNEILAQDEITQLFEPKVLTNTKVFDNDGEHNFKYFTRDAEQNRIRGMPEDTITDNLIIKGNNLLALHSLKKEFSGKVKLIYIDPPYNNEDNSFGYNDTFNHSSWLTFMKNRLTEAKELLSSIGSIWISIDDNEVHYMKILLDEIFGMDAFVASNVWQKRYSRENREAIGDVHEYILVYSKNPEAFKLHRNLIPITEEQAKVYRNPNNDPKGRWRPIPMTAQEGHATSEQYYEVISPSGKVFIPPEGRCWGISKSTFERLNSDGQIYFGKKGDAQPNTIRYLSEVEGITPWTWWPSTEVGHTDESKKEIHALFGKKNAFGSPKPERLLERIILIATNENDLVLDFFAGSGTTAAVAHKMKRKFIACEQMEYIETTTLERLKKVVNGEQGGISKNQNWKGGGSFTYLELKKYNQTFIEQIDEVKTSEALLGIWEQMKEKSFLNYNVDIKKQEEHIDDFKALSLEQQKQHLCEILDKNQLYVNLSSLYDKDFECTDEEKQISEDFYQLKK